MSDDIRQSTKKMCIAYQREAAKLYGTARAAPNWATLDWISSWQEMAAKESEQARVRLDCLNGHA